MIRNFWTGDSIFALRLLKRENKTANDIPREGTSACSASRSWILHVLFVLGLLAFWYSGALGAGCRSSRRPLRLGAQPAPWVVLRFGRTRMWRPGTPPPVERFALAANALLCAFTVITAPVKLLMIPKLPHSRARGA